MGVENGLLKITIFLKIMQEKSEEKIEKRVANLYHSSKEISEL